MLPRQRTHRFPFIMLFLCAALLFAVSYHQARLTPKSQEGARTIAKSQRLAVVTEDKRRSERLMSQRIRQQLQSRIATYGNDRQRLRQWLNQQTDIVYVNIANEFEWSRQPVNKLQPLIRISFSQPQQTNAYIRLPALSKLMRNSSASIRITPSTALNGPHIRTVPAGQQQTSHFHRLQAVVKFKQRPRSEDLQRMTATLNARIVKQWQNVYFFESTKHSFEQMRDYFLQSGQTQYVEAHYLYMTNQAAKPIRPNDLLYTPYQWNLPLIKAEKAWKVGKGNGKVKVAVIDTGIDLQHPDLRGHLGNGYNAILNGAPPFDDVGHGTHVAGIIAAGVNNYEGIAGLSWYNPLLPIKVLDETGSGQSFAVAEGIIWATEHGAKVINLSLGNYARSQFLHDAVRYAHARDVVLVAAAGNENTDQFSYPAAYPEVLAVAAVDEQKRRASFSNYGNYVDVAAPGLHVASTFPGLSYAALSGTSMAAPHVTALAAMMRSRCPELKNTQVMSMIRATATDLGAKGHDAMYGHGLINAERAMRAALEKCSVAEHPLRVRFLQYLHNIEKVK
jgi:type VII secretion-associated serine protease mycosin